MMPKRREERNLIGEGEHDLDGGRFWGPHQFPQLKVRCVEGVEHAHVGCILKWSLTTITLLCGELVRPRLEGRVIPDSRRMTAPQVLDPQPT